MIFIFVDEKGKICQKALAHEWNFGTNNLIKVIVE